MKENNNIPQGNPFRVPDDYFSNLNRRLVDAALEHPAEEKKPARIIRLRSIIAIAAGIALLIGLGITAIIFIPGKPGGKDLSELKTYTDSYLNGIDLLTLEQQVAESGSFLDEPGVSNNELIDYLVQEEINEADIYEKL